MIHLGPLSPISDEALKTLGEIIPMLSKVPEGDRKFVLRQLEFWASNKKVENL